MHVIMYMMMSYGAMAPLVTPVELYRNTAWQELKNQLYESDSIIRINYEGTLLYSDMNRKEEDHTLSLVLHSDEVIKLFIDECRKQKLDITVNQARFYVCTWNTGLDSEMSTISLEKYKNMLG